VHQILLPKLSIADFRLDNPMKTEIHTDVEIKWINDRNVGAQFNNPKLLETDLGFYLQT